MPLPQQYHNVYTMDEENLNPIMNTQFTYFLTWKPIRTGSDTLALDSDDAVYRCRWPHPQSTHPPTSPPFSSIAMFVGPLTAVGMVFLERLPRIHRTYSGL